MEIIPSSINNVFGFWDSNKLIDTIQLNQIIMWAKSILFFHPDSNIYLFTKSSIIPKNSIIINRCNIIYLTSFNQIFIDTPLEKICDKYFKNNSINKAELSDIIRIALIYKYGGTWVDVDDIIVRPFPKQSNILGTFLWENKTTAEYWGSKFNLCKGSLIHSNYASFGFHIQNDPMIRWEQYNPFLLTWMEQIDKYTAKDWGQKLPTNLILYNPYIINNIKLVPQHLLLLHPAFGNAYKKGPMFPKFDIRIKDLPDYDTLIDEN
jgi:hypothetical protein